MIIFKSIIIGWVIWRAVMSFYYKMQIDKLDNIIKGLFELGGIDIGANNNFEKRVQISKAIIARKGKKDNTTNKRN